ncbi:MAG: serine/threonine-protein kinase [Pirellulales bacterium]
MRQRVERLLAAHDDSQSLPPVPDQPTLSFENKQAPEKIGAAIGPYKLKEKIGEGGFGLVFVAEQTEPVRRKVAIKVIKPGMDSRQVIARFEAERQALAMMDHPNIAKVLDAGTTQSGMPYFVMELVRGIPITEYCDKHQMPPKERLELFITVCQAIQHAHQKGIIHRDIKPSNVLVTSHDGKPVAKVIDFGVAKAIHQQLTDHSIYTNIATMIGTPLYMSPEQAEMSGLDIDTRTDIYSLGVLLYELLTGSTPIERMRFAKAAYDEIRRLIREEEPPKPSTRLSSSESIASVAAQRHMEPAKLSRLIRGDLDWITMRALEKDRTRRYETANGLAQDIQRYLSDEPVEACPPSVIYRFQKFSKKNRVVLTTAGGIVLLLVIGLVAFAWQAQVAREERDDAIEARKAQEEQRKIAEASTKDALRQKARAEEQEAEARKQEAEAKKQTAIAQAVAKFQRDMFDSANPYTATLHSTTKEPPNDSITVVQAITSGAKKLDEGSLKDQPMVEASVRDTIGATLFWLGHYVEAERNYRKALEIRKNNLPSKHIDLAYNLGELGWIVRTMGRIDEVESIWQESLEICRNSLPPEHPQLAHAYNNLATILIDLNKFDEAERNCRKALEIVQSTVQQEDAERNGVLINLGNILQRQNKLAEAEALFREAVENSRNAFPAKHPRVAMDLNNLAVFLINSRRYAEAEPFVRESLAINRQVLPAGHPLIPHGLNNLAAILEQQDETSEAESLYREALEIRRAALPANSTSFSRSLLGFSELLIKQDRLSEAEPLVRESIKILQDTLPKGHPEIEEPRLALAMILEKKGKYPEAELIRLESLEVYRKTYPVSDAQIGRVLGSLGANYWRQRKFDQSIPKLEEALHILEAANGRQYPDTLDCLANLGVNYKDVGRLEEAIPLLEEAYEALKHRSSKSWLSTQLIDAHLKAADPAKPTSTVRAKAMLHKLITDVRGSVPKDSPELAAKLMMFAENFVGLSAWDEAVPLLREALEIRRMALPAGHPDIALSLNNLATGYWRQGKPDEAIPLFKESLKISEDIYGRKHVETLRAMVNLGVNLKDIGRAQEAIPLLEEAYELLKPEPSMAWIGLAILDAYAKSADSNVPESIDRVLQLSQKLVASAREKFPKDSPDLAGQLALISATLLQVKAWNDAEPLLRECVTIRDKTNPNLWNAFNAKSMLGGALLGQEKYSEAEPLLLEGYKGMKERESNIPQNFKVYLSSALDRLLELAKWKTEREKDPEMH